MGAPQLASGSLDHGHGSNRDRLRILANNCGTEAPPTRRLTGRPGAVISVVTEMFDIPNYTGFEKQASAGRRRYAKRLRAAVGRLGDTVLGVVGLPLSLYGLLFAAYRWIDLPPWLQMWVLAAGLFAGLKAATWRRAPSALFVPRRRRWGYLFLWPGLDPRPFVDATRRAFAPQAGEWALAASKTLLGAVLYWGFARTAAGESLLLAGWVGMVGMVFFLHFGLFHLLSLLWRAVGVAAEPIMRAPVLASSLGEFWSVRWNRAFSDAATLLWIRPATRRWGRTGAIATVFLISGFLHEIVITLPAGAGFGLPTLYFAAQAVGVLCERSPLGARLGLTHGWRGRLFALSVAAGPVYWLFHEHFVLRVIVPFLEATGAL